MSRRLGVIFAVFLKDLKLLWPLAALTAVLILTQSLYVGGLEMALNYLPLVAPLAAGLFVLSLIHQDAPASLRHDWLTRPIGAIDLILAKAMLTALVVVLPTALGPAIAAFRDGAFVSEALLSALGATGRLMTVGFGLLFIAAVTSTLLEALGVMVGLFLLFIFVPPLVRQISGVGEPALFTGSGWVVTGALSLIVLAGGLVVLRLQYARRRTGAARTAFAGTLGVMTVVLALLNWDVLFAVQRAAADEDPVAGGVTLALAPGCFETAPVDPITSELEFPRDGPWTGDDRRAAGFGAVGFWTVVRDTGLPDGWRTSFIHARATYVDGRGAILHRMEPARIMAEWRTVADGRLEARHAWLINRVRLSDLSLQRAGLRLDYKLALLAPAHVAEVPADGRSRRIAGLGSCTAHARPGAAVAVSCFIAGRQPDVLAARLAGAPPDQEVAGKFPDFAPDVLQLSAAQHHQMILPRSIHAGPPRVTITAYEARAHVARTVTAPALLGAHAEEPARTCGLT